MRPILKCLNHSAISFPPFFLTILENEENIEKVGKKSLDDNVPMHAKFVFMKCSVILKNVIS